MNAVSPGTDNGDEDDETVKDDETVRQVRLSIYQPFTDEETGHGTIPLLSEGVAAGQGSNIKTSEFLVKKDHHQRYRKQRSLSSQYPRKQRVMRMIRVRLFVVVCLSGSCRALSVSTYVKCVDLRLRHARNFGHKIEV